MLKQLGIEKVMGTHTSPMANKRYDGALKTMDLFINCRFLKEIRKYDKNNPLKLCGKVLTTFINIMIEDIIDNNNTFFTPTRNIAAFEIQKFTGEELKRRRNMGLYYNYDLIETHFTAANVAFRYRVKKRFKSKIITLGRAMANKLLENVKNKKY